jgi:hypothetical protein
MKDDILRNHRPVPMDDATLKRTEKVVAEAKKHLVK